MDSFLATHTHTHTHTHSHHTHIHIPLQGVVRPGIVWFSFLALIARWDSLRHIHTRIHMYLVCYMVYVIWYGMIWHMFPSF